MITKLTEQIISIIKNKINDNNIDLSIRKIIKYFEDKGKKEIISEFEKYLGRIYTKYKIYNIGESTFGGYISAVHPFIPKDIKITVLSTLIGKGYLFPGNCDEAYKLLIKRIQNLDEITFDRLISEVYQTTIDYFGKVEDVDITKRTEFYASLGVVDGVATIERFKNSNIAACAERALLSHNLLHFLGIHSTLKDSEIINDGKIDHHYYNLIEYSGKHYIYDSTIPRIKNDGSISPIITEIPKAVYDELNHPRENNCAVKVTFRFN